MILETKRLRLRPWCEDDAESLYEYARDPDIGPIAGWPAHKSVDESREVIKSVLMVGPEAYAVCLKEDDVAIGAIELKMKEKSDFAKSDSECELGFWIAKPFWGRGLIPEAAHELLRRAFEELAMEKVWCAYYDGNAKSKRAQEKIGFQYQWTTENVDVPLLGEQRTGHINCMTKAQWEALHKEAES